jgi:methanogenic corrinoid protein MtbC1
MTEDLNEEFNLSGLGDQELIEQVHDDLYNGLKDEVEIAIRVLLERGWPAEKCLNDALVEGMRIVGIDFRDGILFVPEVLLAASALKAGMEILRPLLAATGVEPIGKVVMGTVRGGVQDIGKNLVSMVLEDAAFVVLVGRAPLNEEFGNAIGAGAATANLDPGSSVSCLPTRRARP